ncbi:hypothetical protein [Pseudomonas citronellolis]|uniref:hypothetical protein n=1 Tax=Pseudomonas citronellolis TaxID=53408 RepID=UPI0023E40555|nr:hypothetical protein [Pseudomonas citronellolis]MDF3936308.1 hypothetical protein [Pseudomonas citronellolis]
MFRSVADTSGGTRHAYRARMRLAGAFLLLSVIVCLFVLFFPDDHDRAGWLATLGAALAVGSLLAHEQLRRAISTLLPELSARRLAKLNRWRRLTLAAAVAGMLCWAVFGLA